MSNRIITGVSQKNLEPVWPHVVDMVIEAQRRGNDVYPINHLYADLRDCTRQLWVGIENNSYEAVAITEIVGDVGRILYCYVDDYLKWQDFHEVTANFFRQQGCKYQEVTGRKGWERRLSPMGYEFAEVKLRREI